MTNCGNAIRTEDIRILSQLLQCVRPHSFPKPHLQHNYISVQHLSMCQALRNNTPQPLPPPPQLIYYITMLRSVSLTHSHLNVTVRCSPHCKPRIRDTEILKYINLFKEILFNAQKYLYAAVRNFNTEIRTFSTRVCVVSRDEICNYTFIDAR